MSDMVGKSSATVPPTQSNQASSRAAMHHLSPPRNIRETLQLLSLWEETKGLDAVLNQVDWSAVTPLQIYHATLDRLPESATKAVAPPTYSARVHARSVLMGPEFQRRIRELVLNAFPEKRRVIFIHVQKTAGTDFSAVLKSRFPWLEYHHSLPQTCNPNQLHSALNKFVLRAGVSDTVAVTGHERLYWYLNNHLVRFGDQVFTIVRDPKAIVISYANFIINRFIQFRGVQRNDTSDWMTRLGISDFPEEPSQAFLNDLAGKIIRTRGIVARNLMCTFLGKSTAETAINAAVTTNIEIVDLARYSEWRRQRWGVQSDLAPNVAKRIVSEDTLAASDLNFIAENFEEDQKFYSALRRRFDASDALSIRGIDLA